MTNKPDSPQFTPARSAAIEALVTAVAQHGTPENRHFQNARGKRIVLSGVAIALAVSGGAVALQMPSTDNPPSPADHGLNQQVEQAAPGNPHDAYAAIPSDQIQDTESDADFIWDATNPYYGYDTFPIVARVHIDSIDGGRTYSPIFDQYTFPQTIGKMTIQTVYKGDVKPGAKLIYNKGGGIVSFDDYWKSLNPQQQDKFAQLNGGQKPTGVQYVKKTYAEDAEITVGKDYIALLLPQQYNDGTAEEYSIQGFQHGFREVKGSGAATTILNNETKTWESLGSFVRLP
ncbi:hypothetical protein ACTAQI_13670 [Pseudarthrobacter sp. alpha12b]